MRQGENTRKFSAVMRLALAAVAVGIFGRGAFLFRSFEYDEWWTLLNFAPLPLTQMLTDLALPNNHPLNTLFVRIFSQFDIPALIRIPSFLAGVAVIALSYRVVRRTFSAEAAWLTAALTALAVPLAVYSALSRGYILQVMCLLLVVEGLETLELKRLRAEILIVTGGIGAMLSVPTGVLLLLPVALGFLLLGGKKRKLPGAWIAAGCLLIFVLCYYLANFSALREGQKWGEAVNTFPLYAQFLFRRFFTFFPPFLLPWVLCGMIWNGKIRLLVPLSLIVLLLAPVTGAGPARIYIALCVICAAGASLGAAEIIRRIGKPFFKTLCFALLIACAALTIPGALKVWQVPDHPVIWRKAVAALPPTALPVVRATAAYPICCDTFPAATSLFRERAASNLTEIAMIGEEEAGFFNGGDRDHNETKLMIGKKGIGTLVIDGIGVRRYALVQAHDLAAGKVYIVICFGSVQELGAEYGELAERGEVLRLNEFLCMPVGDDRRMLGVWLIVPKKDAELPPGKVWELR